MTEKQSASLASSADSTPQLTPIEPEARAAFAWAEAEPVKKIIATLAATAPNREPRDVVRFVGGCVRDSLIGIKPTDIDAATVLRPDQASAALEKAGIAVHPTGIDHGTVTAVCDGAVVEVTTLRADVSTDGRRATVAFTQDWAVDANRRDFTMNALYLTPESAIYDPVGGRADLKLGRVRFIGEPVARIKEDYLRILRFFRFSARFAQSGFDAEGLSACEQLKDGLTQLSAERIGAEMGLLLSLPAPGDALHAMARAGILREVYPHDARLDDARALKRIAPDAPAPLMLAALWGETGDGLSAALRLSGADEKRRKSALAASLHISSGLDGRAVRERVYRAGVTAFADGLLLAEASARVNEANARRMRKLIETAPPPAFALSGKHVLAAGGAPGPSVGAVLKAVEEQWIAENFPGEPRLSEILAEAIGASRRQR